jgi:hypothetical protein
VSSTGLFFSTNFLVVAFLLPILVLASVERRGCLGASWVDKTGLDQNGNFVVQYNFWGEAEASAFSAFREP